MQLKSRAVLRHSTVPLDTRTPDIQNSIVHLNQLNVRCADPFTSSAHGSHCVVDVRRAPKPTMWGRKPWGHGLHAPAIRRVFDEL